MIPAAFEYSRATTIDDALAQLAASPGAKLLAGGHSILPLLKLRLAAVERLIDIGSIDGLRGIRSLPDGGAEVGALTTYADVIEQTPLGWIPEAIEQIADVQVRNRGTVGGALSHADPASDLPALGIAVDHRAVLRSARGEREVPLADCFVGPFQTAIEPDEILVAIRRPAPPDGAGGFYAKLAQPASGYAIGGVAAVVARSGGAIGHARVGITGVGDHPYRARAVEDALIGSDGSASAIAAAVAHATDGVTVNSDIHADAAYRTAMAAVYTRRAIEAALGRSA